MSLIPSTIYPPPGGSFSYLVENGTTLVGVSQFRCVSEYGEGYYKVVGDYTIPNAVSGYVKEEDNGEYHYVTCPIVAVALGPQGNPFTELTSVTVSEGIVRLDTAFKGCDNLRSANLPSSLRTMDGAFYGCSALQFIVIPDQVYDIGSQSFYGCTSLQSAAMPSALTGIGTETFFECSNLVELILPESCRSMGMRVFKGCSDLEHVDLGGCKNIGASAFYGCQSLFLLESVNAVTNIADSAFYNCGALESMTLPNGLMTIGDNAFDGCVKIHGLAFSEGLRHIGSYAFDGCGELTEAVLPDGLLDIGAYAFSSCGKIKKLYIPSSVTTVGSHAVSDLRPVELSEAVLWSMDYSAVTNLVILDGATSFGDYQTTSRHAALKRVELASTVIKINGSALYNCTNLSEVVIKGKVESVGSKAFYGCSGLLEIPDFGGAVTNWGTEVFSGCTGLTKVVVPGSMKDIPAKMFYKCGGIRELVIEEGVESTKSDSFLYDYSIRSLSLPSTLTNVANVSVNTAPLVSEVVTCHQETPPANLAKAFLKNFTGTLYYPPDCQATWDAYLAEQGFPSCGKAWSEATESDPGEVDVGGVCVTYGWLAKYGLTVGSTPEQAANSKTGKKDLGGNAMYVWQDYVAGTDPLEVSSRLTAIISFDADGAPLIDFRPKFDDDTKANMRLYKKWGKVNLKDEKWCEIPLNHEEDYNFFKVTVEMKRPMVGD